MRKVVVAVLSMVLLGATAYAGAVLLGATSGALGWSRSEAVAPVVSPAPSPTPSPTPSPAPRATTTPTPSRSPTPGAAVRLARGRQPEAPVLQPGDRGTRVRELQGRLSQLAWYRPPMTGAYDAGTRAAVAGFQDRRGLRRTGVLDRRTWRRLRAMSRMPTGDEMFDRAGPPLFRLGDRGRDVRVVQARLRQIAWFFGDVSDHYGERTADAVRGFQAKRQVPVTGRVDRRTLDLLVAMTCPPTDDELASAMPWSVFFSGGQAVHYSSDFAARGYAGASHGCVNVRDYDRLASLFARVRTGDRVVVYRS